MTSPKDAEVLADIERWLESTAEGDSRQLIGTGYQASVQLIDRPQGPVIVKEARGRGPLAWLRRATLRREHRAYSRLVGSKGIPHCFGLLRERYLVLEYVPGASLREAEATLKDSAQFFAALLEIIQNMHARGVAHGDLKRKANILVGPEEQPFIVDFGIARIARPGSGPLRRWLFEFLRQTDYNAWIKRKYRRDYRNISPEDRTLYRPLPLEAAARLVREPWRRLTLRRLRKRLRSRQ